MVNVLIILGVAVLMAVLLVIILLAISLHDEGIRMADTEDIKNAAKELCSKEGLFILSIITLNNALVGFLVNIFCL